VKRLEARGLVVRFPCPEDKRATNARLTDVGWTTIEAAAPLHVAFVRDQVVDALDDEQIGQLRAIADAILARLDPDGEMAATYRAYDVP
jgi:DNA-binding MarR family transcriptional regulator